MLLFAEEGVDGASGWRGELFVDGDEFAIGIQLLPADPIGGVSTISEASSLHAFVVVDPNRIPLHIIAGPNLRVGVESEEGRTWFEEALKIASLQGDEVPKPNSEQDKTLATTQLQTQSNVGVLARVGVTVDTPAFAASDIPRITEVLFYAAREDFTAPGESFKTLNGREQTPTFRLHALPLSSDLLYIQPTPEAADDGQTFESFEPTDESAGPKRAKLSEVFEEASDRRKRARRKGGQSVSLAAAGGSMFPSSAQEPSVSNHATDGIAHDGQFAPTSYSQQELSNVNVLSARSGPRKDDSTLRPKSRKASSDWKNFSASTLGDAASAFQDPTLEARNKQTISRTVMAGMRMYGLQQRKTSLAKERDGGHTPLGPHNAENVDVDKSDAEYKNVYHQTYRATTFAFRNSICSDLLRPDAVREVVDRLLAIFCQDPP